VAPSGVVEPVDVLEDGSLSLTACWPALPPDQLRLDRFEECLRRGIVVAVALTVSNSNYAEVGSSCISEVRAIEVIRDKGLATTPFLSFGDPIRIEGRGIDGSSPCGVIDQQVVQA